MTKDYHKINIRFDNKNRAIFFDKYTKNAYVIDKDDLRTYEFYHNRYLASYTLFLLLSILNVFLAIGVAALAIITLEVMFRLFFLTKFRIVENYQLPSIELTPNARKQYLMRGLVFLLLGILLVASTLSSESSDQTQILIYGVVAFTMFSALTNIKAYISK